METPSSTRRVTRSQAAMATALNTNNNNIPISRKTEETEKDVSQSRRRNRKQQQDRSVLIDITNDSPIVGLATGSLVVTPSSAIAKQRGSRAKDNRTPGSGEALLRGQVKTLLQRVEEEAEISKISLENRPFRHLQGSVNSLMGILAPTPANTPQVPNLSADGDNGSTVSVTSLLVIEEQLKICQVVSEIFDGKKQESLEYQKNLNRSLMEDFSEKSDISSDCSAVLTSDSKDNTSSPPTDDDNASIWSIQVNASTRDEEEEDDEEVVEGEEDYYHDEDDEEDGGLLVNELCEGISKINVKENNAILTKFSGKHKRFVYNSDDEMVEEEVEDDSGSEVLCLKGLPTPTGKHLRFPAEEE